MCFSAGGNDKTKSGVELYGMYREALVCICDPLGLDSSLLVHCLARMGIKWLLYAVR